MFIIIFFMGISQWLNLNAAASPSVPSPSKSLSIYSTKQSTTTDKSIGEIDAIAARVFGSDENLKIVYGYRFYKNRQYQPTTLYKPHIRLADIVKNTTYTKRFSRKKENKDTLRALTHIYKIHCMPRSISDFLYKLFDLLERNKEISTKISCIKYAVTLNQTTDITPVEYGYLNHPLIVIYVYGHDDTQEVLNQLYAAFKDEPGRGYQPRFNARVTDLIWVAQGHGDEKGRYLLGNDKKLNPQMYWDLPNRIYFSRAVAKNLKIPHEQFYLHHPITGEVLNSPESSIGQSVRQSTHRQGSLAAGPSLAEIRKDSASPSRPRKQPMPAGRSPHVQY
jgi:hypothetical protein